MWIVLICILFSLLLEGSLYVYFIFFLSSSSFKAFFLLMQYHNIGYTGMMHPWVPLGCCDDFAKGPYNDIRTIICERTDTLPVVRIAISWAAAGMRMGAPLWHTGVALSPVKQIKAITVNGAARSLSWHCLLNQESAGCLTRRKWPLLIS